MRITGRLSARAVLIAISMAAQPVSSVLAQQPESASEPALSYADVADLADSAELVLRAQVMKLVRVEDERAPGLKPGQGRFYIKAKTLALLAGGIPLGESLTYLADLPLDARGRPPRLKKQDVLLFARPVAGRPGELQLVARDGQVAWDPATEATLRDILVAMVAPDAPAQVTGVREAIHVPGNLAGAGETQIFLATADRSAASITVRHAPGRPPAWGASFSELVADVGNPPRRDTLEWYRLACFLPHTLPAGANLSDGSASRSQALADYRMVLGELGICRRNRR